MIDPQSIACACLGAQPSKLYGIVGRAAFANCVRGGGLRKRCRVRLMGRRVRASREERSSPTAPAAPRRSIPAMPNRMRRGDMGRARVVANYADVVGHLKAGTLRALVTPSPTRIDSLPEVPTAAESGYKEFEYEVWFGMFAPVKTPRGSISQLAGWFVAAMKVPDVREKLVGQGLYPVVTCGAEFAAGLRRQYDDYGRVIRQSDIKAE